MDDTQIEAGFFTSRFPEIESERLVQITEANHMRGFAAVEERATYLGIFVVNEMLRGRRRLSLTRSLVEAAAERGFDLYPALYEKAEWRGLVSIWGERALDELPVSGTGARYFVENARSEGVYPGRARKEMVAMLRENKALVQMLVESSPELYRCYLPVLSKVVHETFEFLAAVLGEPYWGDHRDIGQLGESLSRKDQFKETDIFLAPYLVAVGNQLDRFQRASNIGESQMFLDAANAVLDFLKRSETFVAAELMTDAEKKRKRVVNITAVGVVAALVLVIAILLWVLTRPVDIGMPTDTVGQPGGISASYYQGKNFDKFVAKKSVSKIEIPKWNSPVQGVKKDKYSVRWEGHLKIDRVGDTTICTDNDDGVVVYVNNQKIISDWFTHPPKKNCARVGVAKTGWYPIRVDFYEDIGPGSIELSIGDSEKNARPVGPAQLCCKTKNEGKPKRKVEAKEAGNGKKVVEDAGAETRTQSAPGGPKTEKKPASKAEQKDTQEE